MISTTLPLEVSREARPQSLTIDIGPVRILVAFRDDQDGSSTTCGGDDGFPPIAADDDDGGDRNGCEWEYGHCSEKGVYILCPWVGASSQQPEPFRLCQRHFVIWLEYIVDVLGEKTSYTAFDTGEDLLDCIFNGNDSNADGWRNAAEMSGPVDFPADVFDDWLARQEHGEGDALFPMAVMDAMRRKVDEYLDSNDLRLVPSTPDPAPNERDAAWLGRVYDTLFTPLCKGAKTADEKIERIANCDLDTVA